MQELYIANKNYSSWSLRPWLLMTQLNIPFTERMVPFKQHNNFDAFRLFSPTGKVPCLVEHQLVVWDSLAIAEYLYESHAKVWPLDPSARAFARCAAAEMHAGFSALRNICGMSCGIRVQLFEVNDALQHDLNRITELFEQGLSRFGGPFLAGDSFSAVDAFFAPVAFRVQSYGLTLSASAMAYVQHLIQLPAMQQWYQQALAEVWRDEAHEQESRAVGKITADYRQQA